MYPSGHLLSAYTFPNAIYTASYANNSAYYSSMEKKILPGGIKDLHNVIFHPPDLRISAHDMIILTSIINTNCPAHREQVNLMLSKSPPFFDDENFER